MLSKKINAHSEAVMSVAFSPDGTKIVSGSADGTIKVWDSGAPELNARAHKSHLLVVKTDASWIAWQQKSSC